MDRQNQFVFVDVRRNLNIRIRTIGEGATVQESGVGSFAAHSTAPVIAAVRLVFQAWVELHQHKHLVRRQQREIIRRIRHDVALRRSVYRRTRVPKSEYDDRKMT